MRALLHRLFPRLHRWTVEWNDDDVCRCRAVRYWPSGVIAYPWAQTDA